MTSKRACCAVVLKGWRMRSPEQTRTSDWHQFSWRGIIDPVMNVRGRLMASEPIAGFSFSTSFCTDVQYLGGHIQTVDSATSSLTCEDDSLLSIQPTMQLVPLPGHLPGLPPGTQGARRRRTRAGTQSFATSFSTNCQQRGSEQRRVGVRRHLLTSGFSSEGHHCTFCTAHH
jgi:hypothetical protein